FYQRQPQDAAFGRGVRRSFLRQRNEQELTQNVDAAAAAGTCSNQTNNPLFISWIPKLTTSYPLSTKSRWIVDERGQRVKLACVNWPAHLQPAVAEGLKACSFYKRHYLRLRQKIKLNLFDDVLGIQTHNPKILNLPIFNAFLEVVSNLGQNGVMVILDNHLTTPGWCCSDNDLDAFFEYPNFDPAVWAKGLSKMASLFRNVTNVVGMSLRNEPRGTRDYPNLWFNIFIIHIYKKTSTCMLGANLRSGDVSGNRYMNCLVAWAAENDLDWAVWALTGDYYLRTGQKHMVETFGVLAPNWKDVANSTYLQKLSGIQLPVRGQTSF
uniref:Glycoside hydrolase family 5 domain-containing protein n=1 Tax=Brassica oleracea var. oleracea TaxID=109376 RepID=A0A0D3EEZ3_BRAOL